MKYEQLTELLALPAKERIELAVRLCESVSTEGDDFELSPAWEAELARRIAHIQAHPEDCVPWEEALSRIRQHLETLRKN